MTAGAFGTASIWLASKTPMLQAYAPFSYMLCFLLTALIVCTILMVVKVIDSGTTARTHIEYDVRNGQLAARASTNMHRVQGIGATGNQAIILAVFKRKIKHPNIIITDSAGLNPNIKGSFPEGRCGVAVIELGGTDGKIWIDFNAKINT